MLYNGEPWPPRNHGSVRTLMPEAGALVGADYTAVLASQLSIALDLLAKRHMRILLIGPVPELLASAPDCLARFDVTAWSRDICSVQRANAEDRRADFIRALQ